MKWGFRLLGGCLVFCGVIWIISCVYAAVFLASPLYALFAVPGAGPIWLGVWLYRRFWVKFERNREQKRRTLEEQKRKALEEQRLQDYLPMRGSWSRKGGNGFPVWSGRRLLFPAVCFTARVRIMRGIPKWMR